MIIARLEGGLGNIMFQYATGRRLALKNGVDLKFEVSSCWTNPLGDYSLSLEAFNIDIQNNLVAEREFRRYDRRRERTGKIGLIYNPFFADPDKYVREKGFNFEPRVLELGDNVFLHGWWQNEKYFSDIRVVLLKDFSLKNPLSRQGEKTAVQMKSCNSVSVHVRRLDYVTNPKTKLKHGSLGKDYYDEALSRISSRFGDLTLFVFSDDIPWVKENMQFPFEAHYVEGNMDKPHEDMFLMSQCRHNIVANSSFSWWGAWLGTYPDQMVIAPNKWTNYKDDGNDRVPERWIKI